MSGSISDKLLARGWERSPYSLGECGCAPGFCVRSARWTKGGYGRAMCAQHAAQLER